VPVVLVSKGFLVSDNLVYFTLETIWYWLCRTIVLSLIRELFEIADKLEAKAYQSCVKSTAGIFSRYFVANM